MLAITSGLKSRCVLCKREYSTGGNDKFGPKCKRKIEKRMRSVPRFTETQVDKTMELVESAAFDEVRPGIFRVVSGTLYKNETMLRQYLTNGLLCNCPHGLYGSKGRVCNCYHARTVREILEMRRVS
jgi:hypothetical protein